MSKIMIIPVFIPHMGCGHDCVFCNQRKIAGEYNIPSEEEIFQMVYQYRATIRKEEDREIQLAFYGGSFTGLDIALQKQLLFTAQILKQKQLIDKIRMSTRPDYIDLSVVQRLLLYGVDVVEIGAQSFDQEVLEASNRGHTKQCIIDAVALLKTAGITTGIQLMVGLPKDTPDKSIATAQSVIALAPNFVRIYPTVVIKETKLESMWRQGWYEPWKEEVVLNTVANMVEQFEKAQIPIVRIGLQATDNLTQGQDIVAGFYHAAMGELVINYIVYRSIVDQIEAMEPSERYMIECNEKNISKVLGHKKMNLTRLQQTYQSSFSWVVTKETLDGMVRVKAIDTDKV